MIKLAIDLGSSMTKIYRADTNSGVVLAEPSCVAVVGEETEIKAIGKEAKNLIGKTAEFTPIVYPVYEGAIVDMHLATAMLKEFLSRIGIKNGALRRAQVLMSIPCGIGEEQLSAYATLVEECGLRKVRFVEQPYLAALGAGAILTDSDPIFCLDIGGGVSNAAVISGDGIIAGVSFNIGGNNMFVNCGFSGNTVGFLIDNEHGQSPNCAHGSCVGCTFHHSDYNKGIGILIKNERPGFVFDGCQIGFSKIVLENSDCVVFNAMNILRNVEIHITGGTLTLFSGCAFHVPLNAFTCKDNGAVRFANCFLKDGTLYDPAKDINA
jgi:hypothetical protein